jgi:poly(3-hydroxyalkanoate) synthetase
MDACFWWLDHQRLRPPEHRVKTALPWTTPNRVALELSSMRLRDFSRCAAKPPVLICAPYALHGALVADFAPGHSIVETLQRGGLDCVYLTDWRSASPEMQFLAIDNYVADLNVAVDEIGPPVELVGLCQGGWLSLIYAARFPEKVRRLVLVGAPVDMSVESELSRIVANAPQQAFESLVSSGDGIVSGDHLLRFWSKSPDLDVVLQRSLSPETAGASELRDRFDSWYGETLDLPGTYYVQVVNWIFRESRLAKGSFIALGREIHLKELKLPVFLLVGADDEVVPAEQASATGSLLGTPWSFIETASEPSNHLGLFIGSRTLANSWPRIAKWLQSDEPGLRSREIASA